MTKNIFDPFIIFILSCGYASSFKTFLIVRPYGRNAHIKSIHKDKERQAEPCEGRWRRLPFSCFFDQLVFEGPIWRTDCERQHSKSMSKSNEQVLPTIVGKPGAQHTIGVPLNNRSVEEEVAEKERGSPSGDFTGEFPHFDKFGQLLSISAKDGEYINGQNPNEPLNDGIRDAIYFSRNNVEASAKAPITINVPVFMTFMLKKFVQEAEGGRVEMVGTINQRVLFVNLHMFTNHPDPP